VKRRYIKRGNTFRGLAKKKRIDGGLKRESVRTPTPKRPYRENLHRGLQLKEGGQKEGEIVGGGVRKTSGGMGPLPRTNMGGSGKLKLGRTELKSGSGRSVWKKEKKL